MNDQGCGCRMDELCPEHLVDRQRVIGERLALLDGRRRLAPYSRQVQRTDEIAAYGG